MPAVLKAESVGGRIVARLVAMWAGSTFGHHIWGTRNLWKPAGLVGI
jgi:hypothetical protein